MTTVIWIIWILALLAWILVLTFWILARIEKQKGLKLDRLKTILRKKV